MNDELSSCSLGGSLTFDNEDDFPSYCQAYLKDPLQVRWHGEVGK